MKPALWLLLSGTSCLSGAPQAAPDEIDTVRPEDPAPWDSAWTEETRPVVPDTDDTDDTDAVVPEHTGDTAPFDTTPLGPVVTCTFQPGIVAVPPDFRSVGPMDDRTLYLTPSIDIDNDGVLELSADRETRGAVVSIHSMWRSPTPGAHPPDDQTVAELTAYPHWDVYGDASPLWSFDIDGDGTTEIATQTCILTRSGKNTLAFHHPFTGRKDQTLYDAELVFSDWSYDVRGVIQSEHGDFNGDGVEDYATLGGDQVINGYYAYGRLAISSGPLQLGSNDGTASRYAEVLWGEDQHSFAFQGGDFNGDGVHDVMLYYAGVDGAGGIGVFLGPLSGTYDAASPDVSIVFTTGMIDGRYPMFTAMRNVGDVDGDGSEDIVMTGVDYDSAGITDNGVALLYHGPFVRGDARTDLDADTTITWNHTYGQLGYRVARFGDMNGDGLPEFGVVAWGARRDLDPLQLPQVFPVVVPDTAIDTDTPVRPPAMALPIGTAEGAIAVFSNPRSGALGPQDALFLVYGYEPAAVAGWLGVEDIGDQDGDGLADMAYVSIAPRAGHHVNVLHPCSDFGTRVP